MTWRMPVLGQDDMGKVPTEAVDRCDDRIPVRNRERTSGQEVILYIDHDQDVPVSASKRSAVGQSALLQAAQGLCQVPWPETGRAADRSAALSYLIGKPLIAAACRRCP